MTEIHVYTPTQAAEFSGPGKQAIVIYAPDWSEVVLAILRQRPAAYEASWQFQPELRAHVLTVAYEDGPLLHIALVDGIHNTLLAQLAKGCALVLSPFPLYPEVADQLPTKLFDPAESLLLPKLPNPLD